MTTHLVRLISILLLLSTSALSTHTAPSCIKIIAELAPCMDFIKGGQKPSNACCDGVKDVASEAKTRKDRQDICQCLKNAITKAGPYDSSRIPELPEKCGVTITLPPIRPDIDCSKIQADYVY